MHARDERTASHILTKAWRIGWRRLPRLLRADVVPVATAKASLKILIPVFNAARYLEIMLSYYRDNNITVEVLVDTKTTDRSKKIAATFCSVGDIVNPDYYIEKSIAAFSAKVEANWILRLDDDELPSLEMMRFVETVRVSPAFDEIDVIGFPRHQCLVTRDGRLWDCTRHSATTDHRQWRLYRPDRITYHSSLHTAGFEVLEQRSFKAPDAACMIHLDWAVHSQTERRDKFERYEDMAPGHPGNVKDYYLFETESEVSEYLVPFDRPEFVNVGRQLSKRGFPFP